MSRGIRNIKTLLSVGGWTYSQDNHFAFVTDAAARASFVDSAVQLVNDYGFDGMYDNSKSIATAKLECLLQRS